MPREIALAKSVGKPFYIGEFGAPCAMGNRAEFYCNELREWHETGAFTAMLWAFDTSEVDVDISDKKAFARIHSDFDDIANAVQQFSSDTIPEIAKADLSVKISGNIAKFKVIDADGLRIRRTPCLDHNSIIPGLFLSVNDIVEVDKESRTEADGYVWWEHRTGWSVECNLDGSETYMLVIDPDPLNSLEHVDDEIDPSQAKSFYVLTPYLRVRSQPSLEPSAVTGIKLNIGDVIDVDPNSRTEADGYVWWHHQNGWSAEKDIFGNQLFMITSDSIALPHNNEGGLLELFETSPIALKQVHWIQYYGNTTFAFNNGTQYKYHEYSQGLHGGLDLGAPKGTPVFAGLHSRLNPTCDRVSNRHAFTPYRVDIVVGCYRIIYGHLVNPNFNVKGQKVEQNTLLGYIGDDEHVHIEVRENGKIIKNPLLFMSEDLCNKLMTKDPPHNHFQRFGDNQWSTPFDQPDIELGGTVIGPTAS